MRCGKERPDIRRYSQAPCLLLLCTAIASVYCANAFFGNITISVPFRTEISAGLPISSLLTPTGAVFLRKASESEYFSPVSLTPEADPQANTETVPKASARKEIAPFRIAVITESLSKRKPRPPRRAKCARHWMLARVWSRRPPVPPYI